ncbi:MAG: DUF4340 domain-containing protein [Thermodesulfobacteriota bacterium]
MKFKSTWIMLAVLAALGGYFYFVEEPRREAKQEAEKAEGLLFPGVSADAMTELSLEGSGARGSVRVVRGADGTWSVAEPWEDRADEGRVRTLLADLGALKGQREVAEAGADLAPFGLAEPEVAVRAAGPDAVVSLAVGGLNPAGDARYVRAGQGPVRLVSASAVGPFLEEPSELRSKDVLADFPWTGLSALELRRPEGETVRLARSGETWTLEAGLAEASGAQADPDAVSRLTDKLRWARISRFLDEEPARAEAALAGGTAVTLVAEDGTQALLRLASVEGAAWAARDGRDALFTVGSDVLDALEVPAESLRRRKPVLVKAWKVERLELALADRPEPLAYEKAEGVWARGGSLVEGEEFAALQDYLRVLESAAAAEVIDGVPEGAPAEYGLAAPLLSARVVGEDGAEQGFTLGELGGELYARAGGSGPVYRMPEEYLEGARGLFDAARPAQASPAPDE